MMEDNGEIRIFLQSQDHLHFQEKLEFMCIKAMY